VLQTPRMRADEVVTVYWQRMQVRDARITAGREYWVTCAGEEPPPWRTRYATRWSGRPQDSSV